MTTEATLRDVREAMTRPLSGIRFVLVCQRPVAGTAQVFAIECYGEQGAIDAALVTLSNAARIP